MIQRKSSDMTFAIRQTTNTGRPDGETERNIQPPRNSMDDGVIDGRFIGTCSGLASKIFSYAGLRKGEISSGTGIVRRPLQLRRTRREVSPPCHDLFTACAAGNELSINSSIHLAGGCCKGKCRCSRSDAFANWGYIKKARSCVLEHVPFQVVFDCRSNYLF
jgi:hypothetical protein